MHIWYKHVLGTVWCTLTSYPSEIHTWLGVLYFLWKPWPEEESPNMRESTDVLCPWRKELILQALFLPQTPSTPALPRSSQHVLGPRLFSSDDTWVVGAGSQRPPVSQAEVDVRAELAVTPPHPPQGTCPSPCPPSHAQGGRGSRRTPVAYGCCNKPANQVHQTLTSSAHRAFLFCSGAAIGYFKTNVLLLVLVFSANKITVLWT